MNSFKSMALGTIDLKSGRLVEQRFVHSESTFDYCNCISTRCYLKRHSKPVAFYNDKHTVFRVNKKGASSGTGMSQFRDISDMDAANEYLPEFINHFNCKFEKLPGNNRKKLT